MDPLVAGAAWPRRVCPGFLMGYGGGCFGPAVVGLRWAGGGWAACCAVGAVGRAGRATALAGVGSYSKPSYRGRSRECGPRSSGLRFEPRRAAAWAAWVTEALAAAGPAAAQPGLRSVLMHGGGQLRAAPGGAWQSVSRAGCAVTREAYRAVRSTPRVWRCLTWLRVIHQAGAAIPARAGSTAESAGGRGPGRWRVMPTGDHGQMNPGSTPSMRWTLRSGGPSRPSPARRPRPNVHTQQHPASPALPRSAGRSRA